MNGQQLKNSILQMAVQGKLVPQDPNDEPASVLIQRIREEKEKLIKEKKIKKEKNPSYIFRGSDNLHYEKIGDAAPVCISKQVPFDIPDSWEWIRLGELTYNHGQKKPDTVFSYIDIGSIDNLNQKLNSVDNHLEPDNAPLRARKIVEKWDIIYSTVRPYLHNMCIIDKDFMHPPIASTGFAVMACLADYCRFFLFYYLLSPCFDNYANNRENSKGVAYPAINDERLYRALIPVPPMEEQQRIVAKIEQILPYIKEYELSESRIGQLNVAFPEQLKKSILQEAVQGKLVPQDPSDEPASILLEKIAKEKEKLIKEGKIKKQKSLPPITEDEIPFDIPNSWEWVRLGNVCEIARGGSPRPIKQYLTESSNGVNWIKIGDTSKDSKYINSTNERIIAEGVAKSRFVHKGDFLLTNSMSFGRPYILNIDGCIHDGWLVLSDYQTAYDKDFLYYMLSSRFAYYQFCGIVSGAVVKNLNTDKVESSFMPLPPLSEQKRIVAKIEELMPLIDDFNKA